MKLILLGAAGSGKGTIAKMISQEYNIPQISTGEILRQIASNGTKLGEEVASFQKAGILVPDEITFKVLKARLRQKDCKNGFVLDGFPRNLNQAKLLQKLVEIDGVIKLNVPEKELVKRLTSRWQCPKCGHIDSSNYENFTGSCRNCATKLFQRNDDKPETIKVRLEAYKKNITPLVSFYGDKVHSFSNVNSPEKTYARIKTFLVKLEEN